MLTGPVDKRILSFPVTTRLEAIALGVVNVLSFPVPHNSSHVLFAGVLGLLVTVVVASSFVFLGLIGVMHKHWQSWNEWSWSEFHCSFRTVSLKTSLKTQVFCFAAAT